MSVELRPGAVIAQRYRLDRLLGEGGMGTVWAATQTLTRKTVALKFLKSSDKQSEHHRRRFLREARAASAVEHPNVVRIYDVLELADGSPVMVMEFLVGESLESRLERDGRIPPAELCKIMLRVVSAVGTAHAAGIVHRDLKPANIFLARGPGGHADVKVLDFGIAKLTAVTGDAAETAGLTSTGALLGTPYFMSPEQAFGEKDVDHRSDIWSLGVILYRALSGRLPTEADNVGQIIKLITTGQIVPLAQVAPELPRSITELVMSMLSVQRDRRPVDLRAVQAALEPHVGIEPGSSSSERSQDAFGPPASAPALLDQSQRDAIEKLRSAPTVEEHGGSPSASDPAFYGAPTLSASRAQTASPLSVAVRPQTRRRMLGVVGGVGALAIALVIGLRALSGARSEPTVAVSAVGEAPSAVAIHLAQPVSQAPQPALSVTVASSASAPPFEHARAPMTRPAKNARDASRTGGSKPATGPSSKPATSAAPSPTSISVQREF